MYDNSKIFRFNSAQDAEIFEGLLNQYQDTNFPGNGIIRPPYLRKLFTYDERNSNLRLFNAVIDLELTWMFIVKDSLLPAGRWNQLHSMGKTNGQTILCDYPTFAVKIDILFGFTSLAYRCRAWWDKYMGVLILLYQKNQYEKYMKARSRLTVFPKIATKWAGVSLHIQKGFTTVFRNKLVHLKKESRFNEKQKKEIHRMIQYYSDNALEFPDDMLCFMESLVRSLDTIRTAEAHGTGTLRKWSFSMLPVGESRDFSLYNHSNDIYVIMAALRDTLSDLK